MASLGLHIHLVTSAPQVSSLHKLPLLIMIIFVHDTTMKDNSTTLNFGVLPLVEIDHVMR